MKRIQLVFNTTAVNKYGMVFPAETLETALRQSWQTGMPSCIGHDMHRPVAWSRGLGIHLQPKLGRLVGYTLLPETDAEQKELGRGVRFALRQRIASLPTEGINALKARLGKHLCGTEKPFAGNCTALVSSGLARRTFPDVFAQADEDGLVPLRSLQARQPGVFEKDGLLLFSHPFFRRSLSRLNSLNDPFLQHLRETAETTALDVRLALDEDIVGLSDTLLRTIELEYWRGPKFPGDFTGIKFGVARHEADENQRVFHGISRTEFWWYEQDSRTTFECEELKDLPAFGVAADKFGCRFVHSLVDPANSCSTHLDGAIRLYNEEAMIRRLDVDIMHAGRQTGYTKLWRIDGPLPAVRWKELTSHYFRDNDLIGEYLGGDKDPNERPQIVVPTDNHAPLGTFVPAHLKKGDGVRLCVSYHEKMDAPAGKRVIHSSGTLTQGSDTFSYVEADTIELVKVLRRMGESIELPQSVSFVIFEDMVLNLPMVMHAGPDAVPMAEATRRAIAELVNALAAGSQDRLLAYNIGVQYPDRDVYFSVAGEICDLKAWFDSPCSELPAGEADFGSWCERALTWLTDTFPGTEDPPELFRQMLTPPGLLSFERRFLEPTEFDLRWDEAQNAVVADLLLTPENQSAVTEHRLEIAPVIRFGNSLCSRCHNSYHICNCSKYLDEDVCQEIRDSKPLGVFWTNRKA